MDLSSASISYNVELKQPRQLYIQMMGRSNTSTVRPVMKPVVDTAQ